MQFLINGFVAGAGYSLTALSFVLIFVPTRFFNFAHGMVFTCGAYFAYTCYALLKLPLWIAIPLATVMSALLGCVLEVGVYRSLRRRGAPKLVLLLASLGLYIILQNITSFRFGDDANRLRSDDVAQSIVIFGAYITPVQIWMVVASIASFAVVGAILKFTSFGKQLRAVASDAELARVQGIDADRVILGAFALGSALAGLAAILTALDVDMTPTMGLNALVMGIVAMIVGGISSIPGTLLGGLLLGLAQHLGVWKIGSEWQDAIAFAVLIIFLLLRPNGILGQPLVKAAV